MSKHRRPTQNPFNDPTVVEGYEDWYRSEGRRADKLEKALLKSLLAAFHQTESLLEIGCGTGHFTRWFSNLGLEVTGLDISAAMLQEAGRRADQPLVHGDALRLPFGTEAFDLAAMITTLEFIADPLLALIEILRVTRRGLILGVLNRKSRLGQDLKHTGGPIWSQAHLFNPRELMQLVYRAVEEKKVKVHWRTTIWPIWPWALPLPWGGFIGMAVERL